MVPIFQARSEEIGEALIENVTPKYCIPECIIMDQDSTFMSSLMTYLLDRFNIKIKTVAPYNHQSLQAEHGIKLLSCILTKHLTNLGQMWPKYLSLATNLGNYSPYELTFCRKHKVLMNLESNPDIKVSRTFKKYYEFLNKRIKCKCRFLILFFHMVSYIFSLMGLFLLERQAFNRFSCLHQVLKKIFCL